jgi:hypothetical protein
MEKLELRLNNLYVNGYIVEFPEDQEEALYRDRLVIDKDINDQYHTVVEGDRLDLLAYQYYRFDVPDASKNWWIIADANSIFNPFDLSEFIGKDLLIPNIQRVILML